MPAATGLQVRTGAVYRIGMNGSPVMSVDEVADLLGISREYVRRLLPAQGIHAVRGYPTDQVLALHAQRQQETTMSIPTVTNVYYPHRDDSMLYPESEELRKASVRTIAEIIDSNPGLPSADVARLIDERLRATWQLNADALANTEIKVHFLPPGHPLSNEGTLGPDHVTVVGTPHVVGWRTDTGKLSGMTIKNAVFRDAAGNSIDSITSRSS